VIAVPTARLVRKGGLEPPPLTGPDPKSGASANSATFALAYYMGFDAGLVPYSARFAFCVRG
jgi:hypothetical protein